MSEPTQAYLKLVERMHYYEQHPHFDGYQTAAAEYQAAIRSAPVSMQIAIAAYAQRTSQQEQTR